MHYAAFSGRTEVATLLVNSGANADVIDNVSIMKLFTVLHTIHNIFMDTNLSVASPLYKVSTICILCELLI